MASTAAVAAAAEGNHKVRGGSALSQALARSSPPLDKASPASDSAGSSGLSREAAAWLSASAAASSPPQHGGGGLAAAATAAQQHHEQQERRQQEAERQRREQQPPGALGAPALQQEAASALAALPPPRRGLFPFLSCFSASATRPASAGSSSAGGSPDGTAQRPAVSASEVGIRPCFYWLEAPSMSEEDRLFAEANARWLKSDCQDDAVVIEHFGGLRHQTFAGVFDGHGPYGRAAAKLASTRLPQLLAAKAGAGASERKRLRAMRDAFLEVNAAMQDYAAAGFDASLSGTTACCVLVAGRKVLVASTGDSRCVVVRRRAAPPGSPGPAAVAAAGGTGSSSALAAADGPGVEVVPLTWDAKPSLPEEQRRIAQAGGVVKQLLDERGERVGAFRVFSRGDDVLPGLAMSRSLGDLYAHEVGVSAEPVLNTYTLGDRDLFLLLATDGLWDIMTNEEAADFVERYKPRRDVHVSCAEALTLEAQERWKALHDEAIVDDISCVILHTAGLPPPERDNSVPRPLARAASCNDEANELYLQWRLEKERNPSNHRPKQYFRHLYGEEGVEEEEDGGAATEAAAARSSSQLLAAEASASSGGGGDDTASSAGGGGGGAGTRTPSAAASPARPMSPASPQQLRDAPQYASSGGGGGGLLPPAVRARPPAGGDAAALGGSSGALHRMDDISSHSPHSSFGDLQSENSEPSTRRGGAFSSSSFAPSTGPLDLPRRGSSGPQPIPSAGSRGARRGSLGEAPLSLPLETLLRPVRKAYPSASNMQQLASYRSDQSGGYLGDTPRSGDGADLERKVRGGMARSQSVQAVASPLHGHAYSMPAHPSATSLTAWERGGGGRRGSLGSRMGDRLASSSSLGSPGVEPMLLGSGPQSPVVVPLGGGYSRVVVAPPAPPGCTRVQALAPLTGLEGGVPPPPLAVRADVVARGTHLSRTATDTAGILQAVGALALAREAAATAAQP